MDGMTLARMDGRNARRHRTIASILKACRSMMCEGNFQPSIAAVARKADVSVRSVFQHFGDLDSLKREALDEQTRRAVLALVISSTDVELRNSRVVQAAVFGRV